MKIFFFLWSLKNATELSLLSRHSSTLMPHTIAYNFLANYSWNLQLLMHTREEALTVTNPLLFLKSPTASNGRSHFRSTIRENTKRRAFQTFAESRSMLSRERGEVRGRDMQLQLKRSTSVDARNLHRSHIRDSSSMVFAVASRMSRQETYDFNSDSDSVKWSISIGYIAIAIFFRKNKQEMQISLINILRSI